MPFRDRREAGRRLAERLSGLRATSPLILGLPRGGVPVAYEVAKALGAPLDILVVRKLGVPFQPELGMGAVGEDGVRVLNADVLRQAGVTEAQLAQVEARERAEVEERATRLRGGRPAIPLQGRTVVIVDDVLATVDGVDKEIDKEVVIPAEGRQLAGHLTIPSGARGLVVFAHGSGSGRHSPRNQAVARALNDAGLGTLLFDLLSPEEEADRANVFDIPTLAGRLGAATAWLLEHDDARALPIGFFGASTGAGAALWAAAEPDSPVRAVVSRGGRPDLAGARLESVRAPTLLFVGGRDEAVLEMNRDAARHLTCEHRIEVVPGATHLFEEPGALEAVADLAARWFLEHLFGTSPPGPPSA